MVKAEHIGTLEDVRLWAVERDATSEQQCKELSKMDIRLNAIDNRLRLTERKIVWTTGATSALGAVIGSAITIALAFWKLG